MKFHIKLYIGFGVLLFFACLVSIVLLVTLRDMNDDMDLMLNDKYLKVQLASDLRSNFEILDRTLYQAITRADLSEEEYDEVFNILETLLESTSLTIEQLNEVVFLPEAMNLLNDFKVDGQSYVESFNKVMALLANGENEEAISVVNHEILSMQSRLVNAIDRFRTIQELEMKDTLDSTSSRLEASTTFTIIVVVFLALISLWIGTFTIANVRNSLRKVVNTLDVVINNDFRKLPRIEVTTKDEIGSIGVAFNYMAESLERYTHQQKEYSSQLEGQHWLKSRVAEITMGYQGLDDIKNLADFFITRVTPAVGAKYGVVYIRDEDSFIKMASYAGDGQDLGKARIGWREGLVGQSAAEQSVMIIDEPPADYISIQSGIGYASPSQILIIPVIHSGVTKGVLELASFRTVTDLELDFLTEIADTLGMTISGIKGQMQVQKLLKESQILTEELQTQSEELQQQQEELTILNEQLVDQFEQSERKNTELENLKNELVIKNEQLQLASTYKSEFLANISHELRTPLNSILILSQILAENKENNFNNKEGEYIKTIYSSGNELLKLINEILDLSKIEAGKIDIVVEDMTLQELIESVTQHFWMVAEKKGNEFAIHVAPEIEHSMIRADIQKLQQIIKNLLSNAMKFTKQGQVSLAITPATPEQAATDEGHKDWLAFKIKDTGIGIPTEKMELIFESFQQADGTTSRVFGGTGLGLPISKQLIELLGGRLEVQSKEGEGSIFTVYLPILIGTDGSQSLAPVITEERHGLAEAAAATEEVYQEKDNKQLKGKKILLVDDDMRNIYAITSALETYGVHIVFAENGEEGLQLLEKHRDIDLILMDIMMPRMDGYQAIRHIRESQHYTDIPIIALTAKAMKDDRNKCIEAGANDYISKPINMDQLLSLIHVWLYRQE